MIMDRVIAGTAGGVSLLTLLDNVAITLFGVPIPVIGMAAAGTLFSNAYTDETKPRRSRSKLYFWAAATTFLVSASVSVFPAMLGLTWVSGVLQAPFAFILAFGAQWFIPGVISAIPDIIRKVFRLDSDRNRFPYYGGGYDDSPYGREDDFYGDNYEQNKKSK